MTRNRVTLMLQFVLHCSCTQHEAYEEPGQSNGLYALHLLRHIRRDERIERILMDVARGMYSSFLSLVFTSDARTRTRFKFFPFPCALRLCLRSVASCKNETQH